MAEISRKPDGAKYTAENSVWSLEGITNPNFFSEANIISAVQARNSETTNYWAEKALSYFKNFLSHLSTPEINEDALQPLKQFLVKLNKRDQITIVHFIDDGVPIERLVQPKGILKSEEDLFHFLAALGKTAAKLVGRSVNCHLFTDYVAYKYPIPRDAPLSQGEREKVINQLLEAVDDKTFFENIFHQDLKKRSWLRLVLSLINKPIIDYLRQNEEAWSCFKAYLKDRYPSLKQLVRSEPSSILISLTVGFADLEKEEEAFLKFAGFLCREGVVEPFLKDNDFPLTAREEEVYCSERVVGRKAAEQNRKLVRQKLGK